MNELIDCDSNIYFLIFALTIQSTLISYCVNIVNKVMLQFEIIVNLLEYHS